MPEERPGQANVQYGDLRGESAADIADNLGSLRIIASQLGFKYEGTPVGIAMYYGVPDDGTLLVTLQVYDGSFADLRKEAIGEGGTIKVTERSKNVPASKFLQCFKRLNVALFSRDLDVNQLRVTVIS